MLYLSQFLSTDVQKKGAQSGTRQLLPLSMSKKSRQKMKTSPVELIYYNGPLHPLIHSTNDRYGRSSILGYDCIWGCNYGHHAWSVKWPCMHAWRSIVAQGKHKRLHGVGSSVEINEISVWREQQTNKITGSTVSLIGVNNQFDKTWRGEWSAYF